MNKIEMKCLKEVKKMTSESNMANIHVGHSVDSALKNLRDYALANTNESKEKLFDLIIKDLQELKKQNDKAKDTSKSCGEWLDALDNQE